MLKGEHEYRHAILLIDSEMRRKGMSPTDMSVKTKIEVNKIVDILLKKQYPTVNELWKMCNALNLDILFVVLKRNEKECSNSRTQKKTKKM